MIRIFLLFSLIFLASVCQGQSADIIEQQLKQLDLIAVDLVNPNEEKRGANNFKVGEVPRYTDEQIKEKLLLQDLESPIDMVYNPTVLHYINLYAYKARGSTKNILTLSKLHFPLIEQVLDKYNLPLEIKYLACVESALNPTVTSSVGAKGLWQFMLATGQEYGLVTNSYIDERCSVTKSADAAARYLADSFKDLKDWSLVIASYNCGRGNVNKAIKRAGGVKNFWAIKPYLPKETQNYVPAFIAAAFVMQHADEFNLLQGKPKFNYNELDTLYFSKGMTFATLSKLTDLPISVIKYLNPTYTKDIIPLSIKPQLVTLPADRVERIVELQSFLAKPATANVQKGKDKLNVVKAKTNLKNEIVVGQPQNGFGKSKTIRHEQFINSNSIAYPAEFYNDQVLSHLGEVKAILTKNTELGNQLLNRNTIIVGKCYLSGSTLQIVWTQAQTNYGVKQIQGKSEIKNISNKKSLVANQEEILVY